MKKTIIIFSSIFLVLTVLALPEIFHKNKGYSTSVGNYHGGALKNGYLLPLKGNNFSYGSLFSYYILNRAYVNSKLYNTITSSYKDLEYVYPSRKFIVLECSGKYGGKMLPHRTHQNGLSVDFFVPLSKNNKEKYFSCLGIFRYALNFTNEGNLTFNHSIKIDFDVMAKHILTLNDVAKKNGLRIKKVIFNIQLKEKLFKTENGKILLSKGIYFARQLPPKLNKLHDDHYHIDLEPRL